MGDHQGSFWDRGNEFAVYQQNHEAVFQVGVTFHSRNQCIKRELKAAPSHVSGSWTSIHVFPSIVPLLRKCGPAKERKEKAFDQRHFDGRSMLQSSGSPLRFAYNNLRDTIVLRDGDLVLQYAHSRAFDLKTYPLSIGGTSLSQEISWKCIRASSMGVSSCQSCC